MTMKKIFNYFILKISSFKIGIVILVALIYQFTQFLNLIPYKIKYNFYDLHMKSLGYLPLFYMISLFYLIIIYQVCNNDNFSKYLFLKFKSRTQVFTINVLMIFVISFIFVGIINLACIIESIGNISFENTWSQYFFKVMSGTINSFHSSEGIKILTTKLTPLSFVLYNNLFAIAYLFLIGLIFIVSNILLKKRMLSFAFTMAINVGSLAVDSIPGIVANLTFTKNVFVANATLEQLKNNTFITSRLLYFGVLIVSLIVIGNILTKKLDYKFQGEK